MLDILLLYPFTNDLIPKSTGLLPPLGLGYLDAFLKKRNIKSKLVDCTGQGIPHTFIPQLIKELRPKFVGISAMTPFIHRASELADIIKETDKNCLIIIGGSHANALGKDLLIDGTSFDIVVRGEGEETLLEIIQKVNSPSSASLLDILGISFRRNGTVIENPPRPHIQNLDSLDYPTREASNQTHYELPIKWALKKPFATVITSRGCPFSCTFCNVHETFGRKVRFRSTENIMEEIRDLKIRMGIKDIIFYDDTLTVNKERVLKLCHHMIEENLQITWGCYSRVDTIDRELAETMKRAGCRMISFGVESGDENMLSRMQKGITLQQSLNAIQICNRCKIETSASFVVGFPGETALTIQKTKEFTAKLDPLFAAFFNVTPFPGTPLYDDYLKQENRQRLKITEFQNLSSKISLKISDMSETEIQKSIRNLYYAFYFNPKKLLQHVFRILSNFSLLRKYLLNFFIVLTNRSKG
jgi:anaerobic magnesium-protoporphyrin IX monomethyl ester cyclase